MARITIRLDTRTQYKLDYIVEKLDMPKTDVIKGMIDIVFHEIDPPFRDIST